MVLVAEAVVDLVDLVDLVALTLAVLVEFSLVVMI
jgi:hypothetical protein